MTRYMVQTFSKILVCCDGSKYSEKAIHIACNLAKTYDSELVLIHVIDKTHKSDILAGSEYTEIQIGRAHVCSSHVSESRMPSSA